LGTYIKLPTFNSATAQATKPLAEISRKLGKTILINRL